MWRPVAASLPSVEAPDTGDGLPLKGGNSLASPRLRHGVVTKAASEATPAIHGFLRHLHGQGIDVPMPLGIADGIQTLQYVDGTMAADFGRLDARTLTRIGALIRRIHDASAGWPIPSGTRWASAIPAPNADILCHNDLAPWNLVVSERLVFIDWDACAPSSRAWDLAYAAQAFALNDVAVAPEEAANDLAAFVDGYGATPELRLALCDALAPRVEAMVRLLSNAHAGGVEPWATMHVTGHGAHWAGALTYVRDNDRLWRATLIGEARR